MDNDISTYILHFLMIRDRCVGTLLQAIKLCDNYTSMFSNEHVFLYKNGEDMKRVYVGTYLGHHMFVDAQNNTYKVDDKFSKLTKIDNKNGD